jgi:hypothetical protein
MRQISIVPNGKCSMGLAGIYCQWVGASITGDFVVLLQVSHALLAVRLHRVFLLLLRVRWQVTIKYEKKGTTSAQTAGRHAAIAGVGSFTRSLFGMVQKMIPDNDEKSHFYYNAIYSTNYLTDIISHVVFFILFSNIFDGWLINKLSVNARIYRRLK